MIKPEVGRHVHFIPGTPGVGLVEDEPHAAVVAHVHGDRMVNLTVFDRNGVPVPKTSVPLQQPGDPVPVDAVHGGERVEAAAAGGGGQSRRLPRGRVT